MSKPFWLKTSYLKTKFYELFLLDYKVKSKKIKGLNSEKILIVIGGGLGDTLVFIPFIHMLYKKIGKENILIATEDKWVTHYEFLQIETIDYTYCNNLAKRLNKNRKFLKVVYNFKASKVLFLGAYKDFSRYLPYSQAITGGAVANDKINNKTDYIEKPYKVLELLQKFSDIILKEKSEKIEFFIKWPIVEEKYKNMIVVSIGSAGKHKMMDIEPLSKIIQMLCDMFQNKTILLMGTGKNQLEYCEEVIKFSGKYNIINGVDKSTIIESFSIINSCYFFIGVDSALYNAAALFGKKTIGLFAYETQPFEHCLSNVSAVKGNGKNTPKIRYGTSILNSITCDQVKKALINQNITIHIK